MSLLHGELRQGALEGVMVEAVARAAAVPAADVRRALMLAGELPVVAAAALADGREGLESFRLEVLRPVKPMLAQTADRIDEALERAGTAAVEWKLDGARLQVHRLGEEVRAYTRSLADVTDRVPEVVEAVRRLPLTAAVLDGEVIALRPDGRPHPFQVTMGRFGSSGERDGSRESVPLSPFFFDCLHVDGDDLLDRPASERLALLDARVPEQSRITRIETADAAEAERFLENALAHGHEGVMVKSLGARYEAGRRGAGWLKVKRAHTLDLVVLAAEWGHGRRHGRLSNLHLGAPDPATGGFVMLGKTFKGMTDDMLAWQTECLLGLETHREGHVVHVRPELVVEIAFDGVQTSTRYPGGLALRFARVKGYRPDKPVSEADTIDLVRAIHEGHAVASHAAAVYAASASAGSPPAGDTGSTKTSAGRRRGSRMRSWRRRMAPTTSAAPASWPSVRCSPRKSAASASPAGTSTVTRSDAVPAPTRRIPVRNALTAKTLPTSAPTSTPETPTHPPTATISPVDAPNTANDVAAPPRSRAAKARGSTSRSRRSDTRMYAEYAPADARARAIPTGSAFPPPPTSTTPSKTPKSAAVRRASSRSRPRSAAAPTTTTRCA